MASAKKFYYVGVINSDNEMRLVTEIDYLNKTWRYSKDEKPLNMTKKNAEDLVYCMCLNFTLAVVVESLIELNSNLGL